MKTKHFITFLCLILTLGTMSYCSSDDPIPPEEEKKEDPEEVGDGKNYYISPDGSDDNTGMSPNYPYKTFAKVLSRIKPGDIVNIMNGTYSSTTAPVLDLTSEYSGEENAYITFRAMEGHHPVITASGSAWNAMVINASYIIVDGIEFKGNNQNITYEDAYAAFEHYMSGGRDWTYIAGFNTGGITIGGSAQQSELPHHVIVRNCIVHDFPGSGIGAIQADYLTIENNTIYNNAWYTMYACSGISILCPYNSDDYEGYKMFIKGNYCHTNKTLIPWSTTPPKLSDGNGIIIDINTRPTENGVITDPTPYKGRTLVQNNISVNNGGSGIHTFKAHHVDIINNTAYHNGIELGYADIHSNTCEDVNIINNIIYSRVGNPCNERPGNATEVYDYNIYFGGKVAYTGPNDIVADPQFINLTLDRLQADFRLKPGSPGIDSGTNHPAAPSTDITGTARPKGKAIDRGAYEQ